MGTSSSLSVPTAGADNITEHIINAADNSFFISTSFGSFPIREATIEFPKSRKCTENQHQTDSLA